MKKAAFIAPLLLMGMLHAMEEYQGPSENDECASFPYPVPLPWVNPFWLDGYRVGTLRGILDTQKMQQSMIDAQAAHQSTVAQKQQRSKIRRAGMGNLMTFLSNEWKDEANKSRICTLLDELFTQIEQETDEEERAEWCGSLMLCLDKIELFVRFFTKGRSNDAETKQALAKQLDWLKKFSQRNVEDTGESQ